MVTGGGAGVIGSVVMALAGGVTVAGGIAAMGEDGAREEDGAMRSGAGMAGAGNGVMVVESDLTKGDTGGVLMNGLRGKSCRRRKG
jgi:hypothetical protein